MRRCVAVAMAGFLLLAFAGPMSARTTDLRIYADQGWTNSLIAVEEGQTLSIQVVGLVGSTAPGRPVGPAGGTGDTCGSIFAGFSPSLKLLTGPCLVDDAFFGELVAGVRGDARIDWALGDATEIVAPASGYLFFAVNDLQDTLFDNTGSFTILVR